MINSLLPPQFPGAITLFRPSLTPPSPALLLPVPAAVTSQPADQLGMSRPPPLSPHSTQLQPLVSSCDRGGTYQ
ncbi:hypothetical protein JOB18_039175, partial [Solea senegalensis]